ncbi:MAG TPA: hypothetical protein VFZ97_19915 [Acidimicrobiales bacterium]
MTAVFSLASRGHHVVTVVITAAASVAITVILMLTLTSTSTGAPASNRTAGNVGSCSASYNATSGSPAAFRLADTGAGAGSC